MKRIISLLLAMAMILSCSVYVFSENGKVDHTIYYNFETSANDVAAGGTFTVDVNFSNNPIDTESNGFKNTIRSYDIVIGYDNSVATPNKAWKAATSLTNPGAVNVSFTENTIYAGWTDLNGISYVDDETGETNVYDKGAFFRISFKAIGAMNSDQIASFVSSLSFIETPITGSKNGVESTQKTEIKDGNDNCFIIKKLPALSITLKPTQPKIFTTSNDDAIKAAIESATFIDVSNNSTDVLAEIELTHEPLVEGENTITATYNGQSVTFKINASVPVIESIEVTGPTKKAYEYGDTLDTTGLVVTGTLEDGSTSPISSYVLKIAGNEVTNGVTKLTNLGENRLVVLTTDEKLSKEVILNVSKKTLTNVSLDTIADQTYVGEPITPAVTVNSGVEGVTLIKGADYDIRYSDNTDAGKATVTVTNIDSSMYVFDQFTGNFNILKADSTANYANTNNWTIEYGSEYSFEVTGEIVEETEFFGTDGETAISKPVNVGTYYVQVVVKETTNTKQKTLEKKQFKIVPKTVEIAITVDNVTYNGSAQTPDVTVKAGDVTLVKDTDYTVAYSNNTNAGTATVTVTSKEGSNYSFTEKSQNFTIAKADQTPSFTGFTASKEYDGQAYEPTVSGAQGAGEYKYYAADGDTKGAVITAADAAKAGSYFVEWSTDGTDNYNTATVEAQKYTVTKKTLTASEKTVSEAQNIVVNSGNFVAPVFSFNGTTIDGTVTYTVTSGTKTFAEAKTELAAFEKGAVGKIHWVFTPAETENFTGSLEGDISFTMVDVAFTVGDAAATNENALTITNPEYERAWNEIVALAEITAKVDNMTGTGFYTYVVKDNSGNDVDNTAKSPAGDYTVQVIYNGTIGEMSYENVVVCEKAVTIAKKSVGITWGSAEFVYNKTEFKPAASYVSLGQNAAAEVTVVANEGSALTDAKAVNVGSYTASVADTDNYTFTNDSYTFAIVEKAVTVTGIAAENKTYDAKTDATLVYTNVVFDGILEGDALEVTATGTFVDKNVATGKTVNLTGLTLGGTSAANYKLVETGNQATATADITAKTVTITGDAAVAAKEYDGTTNAVITAGTTVVSGMVEGDDVAVDTVTGAFDSKNAADSAVATITAYTLKGTDKDNYTVDFENSIKTATGKITKKTLTVADGTLDISKEYDETTAAGAVTADTALALEGIIGEDVVTVSIGLIGTYADANVGTGKTVTLSNLTLTGDDAANYQLAADTYTFTKAVITRIIPKRENVALDVPGTSTYDKLERNVTATAIGEGFGDITVWFKQVKDSDGSEIANPQAVTTKPVNAGSYVVEVSFAAGENYDATRANITDSAWKFDITKKAVTVNGIEAADKTYDASTDATLVYTNVVFGGIAEGDALEVTATGAFADKNVAEGKSVAISEITLGGTSLTNYVLAETGNQATATADITAKTVTITGDAAVAEKVYDGTTNAAITAGTTAVTGMVEGDDVAVDTVAGAYNSKNASDSAAATITAYTLKGADKDNYVVDLANSNKTATGKITKKTLTAADGTLAVTKVYDGTTAAGTVTAGTQLALTGFIEGDTASVVIGTVGEYADKNIGSTKTVTLSNLTLTGADAANYQLSEDTYTFTKAEITKKTVTIADGTLVITKEYDTTTDAGAVYGDTTLGLTGAVADDDVKAVIGTISEYPDDKVGTYTVTLSGITLDGADKNNYELAESTYLFTKADITKIIPKLENVTVEVPADAAYNNVARTATAAAIGDGFGTMTVWYKQTKNAAGEDVDLAAVQTAPVNAGTYVVEVSFAEGSNYGATRDNITNAAWTINIAKADRTLEVVTPVILTNGNTSATVATTVGGMFEDGVKATYTYANSADSKYKVDANGNITALADGEGTITVTLVETDNYKPATVTVAVVVMTEPVEETATASSDDGVLSAVVDNGTKTITVNGLVKEGKDITVTLSGNVAPNTITINADEIGTAKAITLTAGTEPNTVELTYTVVTDGIEEMPANIEFKEADTVVEIDEAIPTEKVSEVTDCVTNSQVSGLVSAAAVGIKDAVEEYSRTDEVASGAAVYEAQIGVEIVAKDITTTKFAIDITPVLVIVAKDENNDEITSSSSIKIDNSKITAKVEVSVKLPAGFEPKFAKHYLNAAKTSYEFLEITVANGIATWMQGSFSDVDLISDNPTATSTFTFDDGSTQSVDYALSNATAALPSDSKSGYNFNGWKFQADGADIDGFTGNYTAMTEDLLRALDAAREAGKTITATAQFTEIPPVYYEPAPSKPVEKPFVNPFTDVDENAYYYDALKWAVKNKIVNGVEADKFAPQWTLTRAELVTMLYRAAGEPNVSLSVKLPFEDVVEDTFYIKAVKWAYANGVVNGTTATTFEPDVDCTRAEIMALLWKYKGKPSVSFNDKFNDVASDDWYATAVSWGIKDMGINGVTSTEFMPIEDCYRCEYITMLYNYFNK